MTTLKTIQTKLESLAATVANDSITPKYLASLLGSFVEYLTEYFDKGNIKPTSIELLAEKTTLNFKYVYIDENGITKTDTVPVPIAGPNATGVITAEMAAQMQLMFSDMYNPESGLEQLYTDLQTEISSRKTAENRLKSKIAAVEMDCETEHSALADLITLESSTRSKKYTELSTALLTLSASVDSLRSRLDTLRDDHERDLAEHYEQVGIVGFEAIVDEHPSVMVGSDFPDLGEGVEAHVVFDRSRGKFLWEIHDTSYECPGGDAWATWPRASEFMTEDGTVRTDRLFRCGPTLYRFDGTGLVEIGANPDDFWKYSPILPINAYPGFGNYNGSEILQVDQFNPMMICIYTGSLVYRVNGTMYRKWEVPSLGISWETYTNSPRYYIAFNMNGNLEMYLNDGSGHLSLISIGDAKESEVFSNLGISPFGGFIENADGYDFDSEGDNGQKFNNVNNIVFNLSDGKFYHRDGATLYKRVGWNLYTSPYQNLDLSTRTDRLFCCGSKIYRFDGTALVDIFATREQGGAAASQLRYVGRKVRLERDSDNEYMLRVANDPYAVYRTCENGGLNPRLFCEFALYEEGSKQEKQQFSIEVPQGATISHLRGGRCTVTALESITEATGRTTQSFNVSGADYDSTVIFEFVLSVLSQNGVEHKPIPGLYRYVGGKFSAVACNKVVFPATPTEADTRAVIMRNYHNRPVKLHEVHRERTLESTFGIPLAHSKRLDVEQYCGRRGQLLKRDSDGTIYFDEEKYVHLQDKEIRYHTWRKVGNKAGDQYQNCRVKTYRARLRRKGIVGPWVYFKLVQKIDCAQVKFT